MNDGGPCQLQKFVDAQDEVLDEVLAELRAGAKVGHWMWFVFPQLAGLGRTPTAQYFGITSLDQARAYLDHPQLGPRLRDCIEILLHWAGKRTAEQILGPIDALKLCSSLTLFEAASSDGLYTFALKSFFAGERDQQTLALLNAKR